MVEDVGREKEINNNITTTTTTTSLNAMDPTISTIHTLPESKALSILSQISRIEKKTFPTNEAFPFTPDLWKKKPNTRVFYASPSSSSSSSTVIAYAVYVRQRGVALLHKICVAQPYRRRGIGKLLMLHIRQCLQREGCQCIQLWVDKDRVIARALYLQCGFQEREEVADYYSEGRHGIRMVMELSMFTPMTTFFFFFFFLPLHWLGSNSIANTVSYS